MLRRNPLWTLGFLVLGGLNAAYAQGALPDTAIAALTPIFGTYDSAHHCWLANGQDDNGDAISTCLSAARTDLVQAPDGQRIYVVLSADGPQQCQGCAGSLAFAVLHVDGQPRVVAHSMTNPDGSRGRPTEAKAITLRKLGANSWGWIEEISDARQGEATVSWTVWLPKDDRIVQAGALDGSHSNMSGECGIIPHRHGLECYAIKVSYRVDMSDTAAPHYPLVLDETGTKNQRSVSAHAIVAYDSAASAYLQPKNLP